jgi:L-aminopeptidase/D-esterase-like protein
LAFLIPFSAASQSDPRARDIGIPFDGTPGPFNAITDVAGVEVGHATVIHGEGKMVEGKGPARTGVTAVLPRGKTSSDQVMAGWFTLNGNGEMTGTTWVEESGFLEGPITITNTHSVGTVRDGVIAWQRKTYGDTFQPWSLPVVAETWDGWLNDINGFHVREDHVFESMDGATSGMVEEGNVGGGTGMIIHSFKGGIGTSSRVITILGNEYTVGVLVQGNYGRRSGLTIAGVPVGRELTDLMPERGDVDQGSVIAIAATDAPLLPHQLKRMVRRIALGIGKSGGIGGNSSGDIFIAFSTANPGSNVEDAVVSVDMIPNARMNPIFRATIQATEEAVVNALVAAETMTGRDGNTVYAMPHDRVRELLKKYGRLEE